MRAKPELNKPLLRRVSKFVLREPHRFKMSTYFEPSYSCGSQQCLAGTACLLGVGDTKDGRTRLQKWDSKRWYFASDQSMFFLRGKKLLGLTGDEAHALFLTDTQTGGEDGAKLAAKKIALLLEDRDRFVEVYL
jgi:hypothetical protein